MRLPIMADGALAQRLWRVLDAVDYRVMQARLWRVDALYGPEPETGADRRRGCDRESWRRSGLHQPPGLVRPVANASRSPLSTPGTATPQQPCLCSGFGTAQPQHDPQQQPQRPRARNAVGG
jgi:hypothetical protein